MSPFAQLLRIQRTRRALRQQQLADLLGCKRSYVSALENDLKVAPSDDFVERVCVSLELTEAEAIELRRACACSRRRYDVPVDVPPEFFEVAHELFSRSDRLTQPHLNALLVLLRLSDLAAKKDAFSGGRVRRCDRRPSEEDALA